MFKIALLCCALTIGANSGLRAEDAKPTEDSSPTVDLLLERLGLLLERNRALEAALTNSVARIANLEAVINQQPWRVVEAAGACPAGKSPIGEPCKGTKRFDHNGQILCLVGPISVPAQLTCQ